MLVNLILIGCLKYLALCLRLVLLSNLSLSPSLSPLSLSLSLCSFIFPRNHLSISVVEHLPSDQPLSSPIVFLLSLLFSSHLMAFNHSHTNLTPIIPVPLQCFYPHKTCYVTNDSAGAFPRILFIRINLVLMGRTLVLRRTDCRLSRHQTLFPLFFFIARHFVWLKYAHARTNKH